MVIDPQTSSASTGDPPNSKRVGLPSIYGAMHGTHCVETLRDGRWVMVRLLRPRDRGLEEAFVRNLSPETKRLRFLGDFKEPSKQLMDQLMSVDGVRDVAFIALALDGGDLHEVGVSRYAAVGDGDQCEFAVTVADSWRGQGLAKILMQYLIEAARKNHFRRMFSIDDCTNGSMRAMARSLGFTCESNPDDPRTVVYSFSLAV